MPIPPRHPRTIALTGAADHGGLGLAEADHELERGLAHLLNLFVQFLIVGPPVRIRKRTAII